VWYSYNTYARVFINYTRTPSCTRIVYNRTPFYAGVVSPAGTDLSLRVRLPGSVSHVSDGRQINGRLGTNIPLLRVSTPRQRFPIGFFVSPGRRVPPRGNPGRVPPGDRSRLPQNSNAFVRRIPDIF